MKSISVPDVQTDHFLKLIRNAGIYHVLAVISARDVQNGDESFISIRNLAKIKNSERLLVQLRQIQLLKPTRVKDDCHQP